MRYPWIQTTFLLVLFPLLIGFIHSACDHNPLIQQYIRFLQSQTDTTQLQTIFTPQSQIQSSSFKLYDGLDSIKFYFDLRRSQFQTISFKIYSTIEAGNSNSIALVEELMTNRQNQQKYVQLVSAMDFEIDAVACRISRVYNYHDNYLLFHLLRGEYEHQIVPQQLLFPTSNLLVSPTRTNLISSAQLQTIWENYKNYFDANSIIVHVGMKYYFPIAGVYNSNKTFFETEQKYLEISQQRVIKTIFKGSTGQIIAIVEQDGYDRYNNRNFKNWRRVYFFECFSDTSTPNSMRILTLTIVADLEPLLQNTFDLPIGFVTSLQLTFSTLFLCIIIIILFTFSVVMTCLYCNSYNSTPTHNNPVLALKKKRTAPSLQQTDDSSLSPLSLRRRNYNNNSSDVVYVPITQMEED